MCGTILGDYATYGVSVGQRSHYMSEAGKQALAEIFEGTSGCRQAIPSTKKAFLGTYGPRHDVKNDYAKEQREQISLRNELEHCWSIRLKMWLSGGIRLVLRWVGARYTHTLVGARQRSLEGRRRL
jgi:hypothetical protein